jgi:hypothetical protein
MSSITMAGPEPAPATADASSPAASKRLTWVELVWFEKRIERWIRFGRSTDERILDRRRRLVGFEPGALFAFVRWAANDRGTVISRIDILAAAAPGAACSTVPGVTPGGEQLLRLSGWPKVAQVLRCIDAIDALGVDPAAVAPEHWRHVHNRLAAGEAPRPYTRERHRAWLLRRELDA